MNSCGNSSIWTSSGAVVSFPDRQYSSLGTRLQMQNKGFVIYYLSKLLLLLQITIHRYEKKMLAALLPGLPHLLFTIIYK